MMRHTLPGLLLAAALFAGSGTLAADGKDQDSNNTARQQAKAATEAAAREAVAAVQDANRLDLDIRLVGPTSVKIADKR